jgi:hypothetical protein
MSNRDRIAQKQAEADAASKERAERAAQKKDVAAKPAKSAAKARQKAAPARIRIVWAVCESSGNHVKYYPFAQESEAIADAKQRTEQTGKTHFVTRAEQPIE